MKGLLAVLVLVVLLVVAVGFQRGWYSVSTGSDDTHMNVNVSVDKEKVKADEGKAKEKLDELRSKAPSTADRADDKTPRADGDRQP